MKQFKSFIVVATLATLSACGVNDLEDRLDKVEDALGTSEPLKVDFSTTNLDNEAIVNKTSYLFKAGGETQYIYDYGDGTYQVSVTRFSDVEWYEGAWLRFDYNPETKEVTDQSAGTYFVDQYSTFREVAFYENDTNCSITTTVNSFNPETGKVKVNVAASTTAASEYNQFSEKPMNITLYFSGVLPLFEGND